MEPAWIERMGKASGLKRQDSYRLVILGGFGFDNLGDDLILQSALAQLRKTLNNVEITLLSNNPYETRARHKGEIVLFSAEALLRQIILRPLSRVSPYHRKYVLPIPGDSFRRSLTSLLRSDLVLSLGGGYLNDYSKFLTHSRLTELLFVGLCGKSLFLYAHEIGPLRRLSLRILARLALRFVTYATVRDERSLEVLSGLGFPKERVRLTADEGWTYDPKIPPMFNSNDKRRSDELVVALNLMPLQVVVNVLPSTTTKRLNTEEANDRIISTILASLESSRFHRRRILLLPMSSQDVRICSKLQLLLQGRIPCEIFTDLDSQYAALARSHLLVGMRLHTIVMAAQMSVPPIAIGVLPKVFEIMRDMGLPEYAVQGLQLDAKEFHNVLNRALQNTDKIRALMDEHAKSLRKRADLNARIIRTVLNMIR